MENKLYSRIKYGNDWYIGYPISEIRDDSVVSFNAPAKLNDGKDYFDIFADASTLGRCVGITDNNGKDIFVGDIVEVMCERLVHGQRRSKQDGPTYVRAVVEYGYDWYSLGFKLNYENNFNEKRCKPMGMEEEERFLAFRPISDFDSQHKKYMSQNDKHNWRNYIKVIGTIYDNKNLLEVSK